MLGLGNSVIRSGVTEDSVFTPASVSGLTLWLAVNTNITADQNSGGSTLSPEHTSNGGTMAQADRVNFWGGSGGTSINAAQTTAAKKPRWETSTGNLGGIRSAAGNKYMDLSSNVTIDANTDFTILVRFQQDVAGHQGALLGDTSAEFVRIQDADTIRVKTDGSSSTDNDLNFSSNLQAETTTVIIVRSDGATGNINAYLRSTVISNIMATADSTGMFDGQVYDYIIYDGTAVTSAQREQLFDYIEGQSHPQ